MTYYEEAVIDFLEEDLQAPAIPTSQNAPTSAKPKKQHYCTGKCCVHTATLRGVIAHPVDVEVSISSGLPGFSIVGMGDTSVHESRERVKSALHSFGFYVPGNKIVVNLAPSSLKKTGTGFDLPIAVGILVASNQIDPDILHNRLFVGELSLQGNIRSVTGMLAYALCAQQLGMDLICAPSTDATIASKATFGFITTIGNVREGTFLPTCPEKPFQPYVAPDFCDIQGHEIAKRALQIAAAGNHGVLMSGPPGSGKTMLASRLPSILPPLEEFEKLEAAVVHSVAGMPIDSILAGIRPFRNPHHSATLAGLVGGGSPPRPGEISLAHRGVLFLDELPEFSPSVLQGIRQPMESGLVTITRADGTVEFPAHFQVVAAANPCPCGYFGDPEKSCTCTIPQIRKYQGRIGGPILDRIDIHLNVSREPSASVLSSGTGISSATLREAVFQARAFRAWRLKQDENYELPSMYAAAPSTKKERTRALIESCHLSETDHQFLETMADQAHMSGRSLMSTLAIARTIADMEESCTVSRNHLFEAFGFRVKEGEM